MKFTRTYSLREIAVIIDCKFVGDAEFPVMGMNEIHVVEPGDIVFVDHPKYYDKCLNSAADFIIINTADVVIPEGKIDERLMTIPGIDGQKMSKSYNNYIDIFLPEKELKKQVILAR